MLGSGTPDWIVEANTPSSMSSVETRVLWNSSGVSHSIASTVTLSQRWPATLERHFDQLGHGLLERAFCELGSDLEIFHRAPQAVGTQQHAVTLLQLAPGPRGRTPVWPASPGR